jgi:hypothetical protein
MQRIQYHRYGGPEEMRLETYELPALGEYVHDPRAVPAGHPFSCRASLKRDEHGARYLLRQELARLACVPTKNASSQR